MLLLSVITFAFNRESEQKNSSPTSANTILDADVDKTKTVQQEVQVISPEPKPIAKTNIDDSSEKPIQPNEEMVIDDRFILFDEDLYNEKNAKEIEERNKQLEEQNKKLEEKLREEQKRYEARAREARKREQELKRKEDKRRRQEEKQNGGIKNSYKKVYHPVKKNVFRPIKKGFNKIKNKID